MSDYPKYGAPFEQGEFYHIYNCAVGKEIMFINDDNYHFFLDRFYYYTRDYLCIYAYCLLRNHFHFLVRINDGADHLKISEQLRKLFISYSKAFNKQQKRTGSLFEKHLKRIKIVSDNQLLWTIYYIHRNPVHHRISSDFERFTWSSYRVIISDKNTKLKREEVLGIYSGKKSFMEFHQRNIENDQLQEKINFAE